MSNGGVIGVINTPTTSVASGVWTLNEVLLARSQDIWPGQPVPITVNYLVAAGGAGAGGAENSFGGGGWNGGGGGAGGLRSTVTATGGGGTLETALTLEIATNYTVTVGAGGAGGAAASGNGNDGTNGSNSVFSSITSTAGGGGGGGGGAGSGRTGIAGGSGGGGGSGVGGGGAAGTGTSNQGFAGAVGIGGGNAGGGGGAGAVGGSATARAKAAGVASSITGSSITRCVGGSSTLPDGGNIDGPANSGDGGDMTTTLNGNGRSGGSGVVILRYADTFTISNPGGGLTLSTATDGSFKVTTVTAGTGNVSWS